MGFLRHQAREDVNNGEARAYPQYILVWHEIVNDTFGGSGVSITYCPLTGTAIGFERGSVEFGVSGRLVNSNLIMYDRDSESWWPQILGAAIRNPQTGHALSEVPVVWTTWNQWRHRYPDTLVLSEDTGYLRSYQNDPYGTYNPIDGYYSEDWTVFPSMHPTDKFHKKSIFIGTRNQYGAIAVNKDILRQEQFVTDQLGDSYFSFVYDPELDTGYGYLNPEQENFTSVSTGYRSGRGPVHPPDDLPLDRVNAFDAMWFAWYAFYPQTTIIA